MFWQEWDLASKKPKKQKACPKCGTMHDKSGQYCSRTCANSRSWSEDDKQKKRESVNKYYATADSIAQREAVAYQNTLRHADEIEDVDIVPYMSSYEDDRGFVIDSDGDVWENVE